MSGFERCALSQFDQPDNFSRIMDGKRARRDALVRAISAASSDDLEAASQRLRKVMRESKGCQRRQRIDPPALDIK